jgi:glycosyltransferase involved in cell wall biosynthesis
MIEKQPKHVGKNLELSIVIPCLNEERTVGDCVAQAKTFLLENHLQGEVIVADNGSTDRSADIARSKGARVVEVADKGYGNALRAGFSAARGGFIIMADSDGSHDLLRLMPILDQLRLGYELVVGNRFWGGIAKGAMRWHHRYIGNPLLSFIGRLLFRTPVGDFHCGLRGLTREAVAKMNLQSAGMELASEIIVKASILGMRVCEVPVRMLPDRRGRAPHLRSFSDGWRHLRFLLMFSPRWLFAYPGLALLAIGTLASLVLSFGPLRLPFLLVDFHSFIIAGTFMILGISMLSFFAITRVYTYHTGLLPKLPGFYPLFKLFNLEKGLILGLGLLLLGIGVMLYAVYQSQTAGFETIGFVRSVRLVFGGSLSVILGVQVILTSIMLSMLGVKISRAVQDIDPMHKD